MEEDVLSTGAGYWRKPKAILKRKEKKMIRECKFFSIFSY